MSPGCDRRTYRRTSRLMQKPLLRSCGLADRSVPRRRDAARCRRPSAGWWKSKTRPAHDRLKVGVLGGCAGEGGGIGWGGVGEPPLACDRQKQRLPCKEQQM